MGLTPKKIGNSRMEKTNAIGKTVIFRNIRVRISFQFWSRTASSAIIIFVINTLFSKPYKRSPENIRKKNGLTSLKASESFTDFLITEITVNV